MMVGLVPLATIVVSVPMLGVWPTGRQVVGVLGGFLCMLLLLHDGTVRGISPGILALALTVPVSYGLGNTYVKWKLSHVHSVPLTTLLLATAAAWLVPLELMPGMLARFGLSGPTQPHDWPMAVGSIGGVGNFGDGVRGVVGDLADRYERAVVCGDGDLCGADAGVGVGGGGWGGDYFAAVVGDGGRVGDGCARAVRWGGGGRLNRKRRERRMESRIFCPSENPVDGIIAE